MDQFASAFLLSVAVAASTCALAVAIYGALDGMDLLGALDCSIEMIDIHACSLTD